MNYFVFLVSRPDPDSDFHRGDVGVGYTHLNPGIQDCLYGTLLVIPREAIKAKKPSTSTIKKNVFSYFGVELDVPNYLRHGHYKY